MVTEKCPPKALRRRPRSHCRGDDVPSWDMCPNAGGRARRPKAKQLPPQIRDRLSSDDAHEVVYFKRHVDDDPNQTSPGRAGSSWRGAPSVFARRSALS